MELRIKIAGRIIDIRTIYNITYFFRNKYIVRNDSNEQLSFFIRTSQADIDFEKHIEEQEATRRGFNQSFYYPSYLEAIAVNRLIATNMLSFDTFLMHGSVVALDNQAYMFTAPSGTGKTTRTRIFRELYPNSFVVNGDKPLIKITPNEAFACGTPWCGKEGWNTDTMVPLKAIFLLERADEGEKSFIEEVSLGKAFPFLLQQTYRPEDPDLMRKTLYLLKSLNGKVKIYKYRSTPTEESVRLAYEMAKSD